MLRKQNISINIDSINLHIGLDQPGRGILVDINKLMIDTAYWRNKPVAGTHFDLEWNAHQLLFIENITIKRKMMQGVIATTEEIKLKYFDAKNELCFTIKRMTHKTTKVLLLSIPNANCPPSEKEKKALTVQLVFKSNVLANLNVIVAPVHLYLSDIDMLEAFSPLMVVNTYYSHEKLKTARLLNEIAFEPNHFETVKNFKQVEIPKPQRIASDAAHVGPLLASPDILIAVMAGGLVVQWAKMHEVLFSLKFC